MRDMTNSTQCPSDRNFWKNQHLDKVRPLVQAIFIPLWLSPFGVRYMAVPGCVFHCYGCPLSTFACPIGVMAQFSALHVIPALAIAVVVLVGALIGSLVCGWMCPFGFLQDLLARIPTPKLQLPNWMGYGRYLVLAGLVFLVPYLWGENHPLFICRVCPAGGLEASLPGMAEEAIRGQPVVWMSGVKIGILAAFVLASLFILRPWCRILCPLGGLLALFNRSSAFYLRFHPTTCTECNQCRTRCRYGVKVDESINNVNCVRCLECTTCAAITPAVIGTTDKKVTSNE